MYLLTKQQKMLTAKNILIVVILSLYTVVCTAHCVKCTSYFTGGNDTNECICNHGLYCNNSNQLCEQCPDQFFSHGKYFNISKGTTIGTLKTLLPRYHAVNVYHLVRKLHKLSATLFNESRQLDQSITSNMQRIDFLIQADSISQQHYQTVKEKLKLLRVETNNSSHVKRLLKLTTTIQYKYRNHLPRIDISFLRGRLDIKDKTDLLDQVANNLMLALPSQDWFNQHDPSTFYIDEIYYKIREPNAHCDVEYEKLASGNRRKLQRLRNDISEIIQLLFPKTASIGYEPLLASLGKLRINFQKTSDLADEIVKKKRRFDKEIILIHQLFEMTTKMKKLYGVINNVKEKMSILLKQIKLARRKIAKLAERLKKVNAYKTDFTSQFNVANDLLKKVTSLRHINITKLDVQKFENYNRCLESRLDGYIVCIEKISKIYKVIDSGCQKLETLCSLNVNCDT